MPRHLISDAQLQEIYERRLPSGPAFTELDDGMKAEFRLFVESRGVLWNPRWGMVGRMNAYGAFRDFTLAEQGIGDPPAKETSASRAARINAKMNRIMAKADEPVEQSEEEKEEAELNRLIAAKMQGKGPRRAGGEAHSEAEREVKAKILALQKQWAALTEASETVRRTYPGDPKVPGSFGVKKRPINPATGKAEEKIEIVYPLSPRKEKIIDQIQGLLYPFVKAAAEKRIQREPPNIAARLNPEAVADKVVVDWGIDVRLIEKRIEDGKYPAHGSFVAGTYKTEGEEGERRPEEYFDRYEDAPPNRPYCDIVRDVVSRIDGVVGSMSKPIKADPTLGSPEVDVTGERGEEDEEAKVTPVAPEPEVEEEEEGDTAERLFLLSEIERDLRTQDPDTAKLFRETIRTPDPELLMQKLGWDRHKFGMVKRNMQRLMGKYLKNPRYSAAIYSMGESARYRPLLRMAFPGLFIAVPDVRYTTYRKFDTL